MWIWTLISVCVCVPLHLSPSCRHTTSASLSSHWSSHMEPHCPAWKTSTVPSELDRPPTSRIGSATTTETHTRINAHIHTKCEYPSNFIKLIKFVVFCKYALILNLMPATRSKKSWDRGNKSQRKLWNVQKTPVRTFSQSNRVIGNRC